MAERKSTWRFTSAAALFVNDLDFTQERVTELGIRPARKAAVLAS